ncbi:MAG: hypothetical protein ABSF46_31020 [Terriglobia bacterium]|jgi:hypothetical protein
MVAGVASLIAQEINLNSRAAQIGRAQHELLLDYGFTGVQVGENTTVYESQSDGYQVTQDAIGH